MRSCCLVLVAADRYCSRACQAAHRQQHKLVPLQGLCDRLAQAAIAAAAVQDGDVRHAGDEK